MSCSITDSCLNGVSQRSALQLDQKPLPTKDNIFVNGIINFPNSFKTEKIQNLVCNGDDKNNNDSIKKSSSTSNGQCYPMIATKEKWLSTILDNTEHEETVKDEIEKRSEFVANLPSMYRLPLNKEHCVSLNTDFGRHLLASTLYKEKYGNMYFMLSQQFLTQGDAMLCGPSSLVVILNALGVDPGRQWRYPWRWYDEDMLKKCQPTQHTLAIGCSLDALACMAKNNGLCVDVVRASQDWKEENFRNDVKQSCSSFDQPILINFSRRTLKQTGSGHFSPIGAYNKEHDMVLVMETARFKYPPFWTKLSKLWESLQSIAVSRDGTVNSGMPRGYLILRKPKSGEAVSANIRLPWQQSVVQMKTLSNDEELIHTMYAVKKMKKMWELWFHQKTNDQSKEENKILIKAVNKIIDISKELDPPIHRDKETSLHQELSKFNFPGVEKTSSFKVIKQRLQHIPKDDIEHLTNILVQLLSLVEISGKVVSTESQADLHDTRNGFTESNGYLADNHVIDFQEELNKIAGILTTMVLFWPYAIEKDKAETEMNRFRLEAAIEPDMIHFPHNRATSIPEQLKTILKSIEHVGHEVIYGGKFVDL